MVLLLDSYEQFLDSFPQCRTITVAGVEYNVIKHVRRDIDDANNWSFEMHLKPIDRKKPHILEIIWNEDRDIEFVGVFMDGTQIDAMDVF